MTEKNDPWSFVQNSVNGIEDYYGLSFRQNFGNRVASDIVNELLDFGYTQLPDVIYAMCIDGKIRKGTLSRRVAIDMIAARPVIASKYMTTELWQTILTKTNSKYTYCFETKTFHPEILPAVGIYLMKHSCSANIYNVLLNNTKLSATTGESARVFDMYVKREKSISAKKDIFKEQLSKEHENLDINSNYFAWKYVKYAVMDNEPEYTVELDSDRLGQLKDIAAHKDIIYEDLIHRIKLGMDEVEAINKGLSESELYGFKYVDNDIRVYGPSGSYNMPGTNYNLMSYIKYLASIEELVQ